jgi:2-dehydropantoate 2-reductase
MKICIAGAGAIGGFIGTRLAAGTSAQVSVLARGATLAALQSHGWRLRLGEQLVAAPAVATDDATQLGVQDLVVVAVKGPALAQMARSLAPLIGPSTLIMPAMNGVPWWFCQRVNGFGHSPLHSVDPGGLIAQAIPATQVLGCVVHASTSTPEPGLVQHKMGHGLIIGEAFGGESARAQQVVDILRLAGFEARLSTDIRYDIWYKLWGNMTMNPVSAITGATVDRVMGDPLVREFCSAAMREAAALGARLGCPISESAEDRHAVTARLGAFKTSMLQDAQAGRTLELDALVGAVAEIGVRLGHAMPNVNALLGLTRLFGQSHGLYPLNP